MYNVDHDLLLVCLSLSTFPQYCMHLDVTMENRRCCPWSSALLGRFAIGALVLSLLQCTRTYTILWDEVVRGSFNKFQDCSSYEAHSEY